MENLEEIVWKLKQKENLFGKIVPSWLLVGQVLLGATW